MKSRRLVALVISIACLFSCETLVLLESGRSDPKLCVNAQFLSCDSLHTVALCISDTDGLYALPAIAEVSLQVNGIPAGNVESVYMKESFLQYHIIRASLQEGDSVELGVRCGDLTAYSVTVVPPAPVIEKVDTVFDGDNRLYSCSMVFCDHAGEDTFFTVLDCPGIYGLKGKDGVVRFKSINSSVAKVDGDNPVFINDKKKLPGSIAEILGYEDNGYRWIFTDHQFRDSSYSLDYIFSAGSVKYWWGGEEKGACFDELYGERTVIFRLGSLNQEFYRYYSYIDHIVSGTDPLAAPLCCPENIIGGIGFFGIVSVTEYPIRLPDEFLGYNRNL